MQEQEKVGERTDTRAIGRSPSMCNELLFMLCGVLFITVACRRNDNRVIVRILVPPSASAVREAITRLEVSQLTTDKSETVAPATMETNSEDRYRQFLQQVDTYRPQVVIAPKADDIPVSLRGETLYPTLPCSAGPSPCVAVIAPWATAPERRAADLLLRHIDSENTK